MIAFVIKSSIPPRAIFTPRLVFADLGQQLQQHDGGVSKSNGKSCLQAVSVVRVRMAAWQTGKWRLVPAPLHTPHPLQVPRSGTADSLSLHEDCISLPNPRARRDRSSPPGSRDSRHSVASSIHHQRVSNLLCCLCFRRRRQRRRGARGLSRPEPRCRPRAQESQPHGNKDIPPAPPSCR